MAAPAPAATKTVPFVFHYQHLSPLPSGENCPADAAGRPGLGFVQQAHAGVEATDTWVGRGFVTDRACVYVLPDGSLDYTGTESGLISLQGCGTGRITFTFDGHVSAPAVPSLIRTDGATVTILPGSGTGDLAGLQGGGVSEGVVRPDLTASGVITGTATCPARDAPDRCLTRRAGIGRRAIGPVRLGLTRRELLRLVRPRPVERRPRAFLWCVGNGATVAAVFGEQGRSAVVATAGGAGSRLRSVRRAYPRLQRLAKGLFRAGPRRTTFFLVRQRRVLLTGIAEERLLDDPRVLLRMARRAR